MMLAPYEIAPTAIAAAAAAPEARNGAKVRPSSKLVSPATAPFHSVLRAGVIPSISAERRLSMPQQAHAPTTNNAPIQPARPDSPASIALAPTTPATPIHAERLRCS